MADKKISQFDAGGLVTITDVIAAVRAGVNVKVTFGNAAAATIGTGPGQVPTADQLGALASLDTVGAAEIDANAVGTTELDTNAVTTAKVTDKNITYAKIQDITATARVLGRKTAGAGVTEEVSLSELLDFVGSAAQGDILYRNATTWVRLPAGTANYILRTRGPGQNPDYVDPNTLVTIDNQIQDFRLTLTTGVPVTTADVTGATTMYAAPYKGNRIALYDTVNTVWKQYTSAQMSLALGTLTNALPYDVFCYANAGVPTLEFAAWTNGTTRATALTRQDGVLVKTGALDRRYLGTFFTTATTTTEDSTANRFLWNYYHRVRRGMSRSDATASWSYGTNTFRQANASTANQLNFVLGVAEDIVDARVAITILNSTATLRGANVGVGLNSTSVQAAQIVNKGLCTTTAYGITAAEYNGNPPEGRNFLAWIEAGAGADTQTWYGASTQGGGTVGKTGISGSLLA